MSGDMAVSVRVPDTYTVIVLTSVLFSCVWAVVEKQDVRGNQQQPFKEETESQTFAPSAPVLSQMDYEILGTSGFSITDVTQNVNFSDVSKVKRNELSDKKQLVVTKLSPNNSAMKRGINIPFSIFQRYPTLVPKKERSSSSETQSFITATRPELTTELLTEDLNFTGVKDESTIISHLQFSQDLFTKRTESVVTAANILNVLEFSPTINSLFTEETADHRQNLPAIDTVPVSKSTNLRTHTATPTTMSIDLYNYPVESSEVNERRSLTVTQGNLKTISNPIDSTVQLALTNDSSSSKIKQIETVSNLRKENESPLTANDSEISGDTNSTATNLTLLSVSDESYVKHSQNKSFATNNTLFMHKSFTIQPYSLFTSHIDINSTSLSSSNTETESATWRTANTSVLNEESTENLSTDKIPSSTELSDLQFSSVNEEVNSFIPKVDHLTPEEETESIFSSTSSTESLHVTTSALPTLVTTDIKSTHVTPLFTEKPQLLVNVSGQIRIIRGMIWMYQLNDKMSAEFQYYSRKVQRMLEEMFWQTWLAKHIKKIDVHRFRRGSVMVDFRLVVKTERHIQAQEMEMLFNSFLLPDGGFGGFQMDRHFTKFEIVEPVVTVASPMSVESNNLPQWATALIVISGASLIFVVLFGIVTVYGTIPLLSGKNHQRLKDEESARSFKQPKVVCTEWERKAAAAYENLSADGIYDLDEAADGYKRKLESTEA